MQEFKIDNIESLAKFSALSTKDLVELETLTLNGIALDTLDTNQFEAFCKALFQCQKLRKLELIKVKLNTLSEDRFKALREALSPCSELEILGLFNNELGSVKEACFPEFRKLLLQFPKLQVLRLVEQRLFELNEACINELEVASSQLANLQHLDLSHNSLAPFNEACFKAFCKALSQCQQLQTLDLSDGTLGRLVMNGRKSSQIKVYEDALGDALSKLPELKVLNLSRNHLMETISTTGFLRAILRSLAQTLHLDGNFTTISDTFFKSHIEDLFSQSETLTKITGFEKYTKEQQEALNAIFNKNKKFIEGIQDTLDEALAPSQFPDTLQSIVMDYMLPPKTLPKEYVSPLAFRKNRHEAKDQKENIEPNLMLFKALEKDNYKKSRIEDFKNLLNIPGVNINAKGANGLTLLHAACKKDVPIAFVAALLEKGADPNQKAEEHTCLDYAIREGREDIVTLFIQNPIVLVLAETLEQAREIMDSEKKAGLEETASATLRTLLEKGSASNTSKPLV